MKIRVALAWLDREDWPRWQEIDPSLPSYDEWVMKVEARHRDAHQRGVQFEVIRLDPPRYGQNAHGKLRARRGKRLAQNDRT